MKKRLRLVGLIARSNRDKVQEQATRRQRSTDSSGPNRESRGDDDQVKFRRGREAMVAHRMDQDTLDTQGTMDTESTTECVPACTDPGNDDNTVGDASHTIRPTAEPRSGSRVEHPLSPMRAERNRKVGSVAEAIRLSAEKPTEFKKMCKLLVSRGSLKWPVFENRIEAYLQDAIEQGLTCEHPVGQANVNECLWRRLKCRVIDGLRTEGNRTRLLQERSVPSVRRNGEVIAEQYAQRASADEASVNVISGLKEIERVIKEMSKHERLAFRLHLAGNPMAQSPVHRHALRHAMAKLDGVHATCENI